jgi:hypothetical protein
MANPMSAFGMSDHNYAMAIGVTMGESIAKDGLPGKAGIMDVMANRQEDPGPFNAKSSDLADIATATRPNGLHEFNALDYGRARVARAYRAALDPAFLARHIQGDAAAKVI